MDKTTLEMNQTECDKCCGSGKVFNPDVVALIVRWRNQLRLPRKMLAGLARIPYTSYCKFEKGSVIFSEKRLRKLVELMQMIENLEAFPCRKGFGLCSCAVRQIDTAICPRCERPYSSDGHVFTGRAA